MGFLSKLARSNMQGRASRMPRRPGMIRDMRFLGRMPQKRSGFGFGLGEAIRRLNQQQRMMPQPIPRAEIDISALERLPMGDMPMSQDLPEVAPVGMMPQMRMGDMEPRMMMAEGDEVFMDSSPEQQAFSIETEIKNLMNEYEMAVRNNEMDRAEKLGQEINRMEAYKIQMMANALEKSDEEFERDLYRDTLLSYPFYDRGMEGNRRGLDKYGNPLNIMEDRPYQVKSEQSTLKHFIDKEGKGALDTFRKYRRPEFDRRPQLKGGGDFPDLTGDGKVTQADILKGRGVYAEGDEVKSFADYQPEGSLKGTFFDYIPDGYQVSSFLMDKFGQEAAQDPTIREMFEGQFKAARMAGKDVFEFMGKSYNTKTLEEVEGMRYGGEMERFQDGGEIDAMLSGMGSEEAGAMEDLEQMAPEMEMIDQYVEQVVQMIQAGASEQEVIEMLMQAGLDEEDINVIFQAVLEVLEGGMQSNPIDDQLAQIS